MPVRTYTYDSETKSWYSRGADPVPIDPEPDPDNHDWSDGNLPWAYTSTADWEQYLPAGVPVVNLSSTGATFYDRLNNTVNSQPGRFICRLPDGVHTLTSFRPVGSSGNPTYAFGFWFPKLAGFVGNGPDKCIVEMAPNSVSPEQLDWMSKMTASSFIPLQMGLFRIDTQQSGVAHPIYLGGVTFEAGPQNPLTSLSPDMYAGVYVPQSAPHQGVVVYSDSNILHPDSVVAYCRFRGAGKAMTSAPPFEMGNFTSQRNHITYRNNEFDGRMSPRYDATQPRKCGTFMLNGGVYQNLINCWLHHSNVSRYAANDEAVASGAALSNLYRLEKCKIEQITNNQNRQPPINNGESLGGYTNASCLGWESSNALIEVVDCIVSVDNEFTTGQVPCHLQLTDTGPTRVGGRLFVVGGEYRHTKFPQLNGFVTFRIQASTRWWTDGFNTTLDVRTPNGTKLSPYQVTGSWPPSQAALVGAGVTPQTHYLVRAT